VLNLGKLSDVSCLNTVLVSVDNGWYSYCLFVLLMSLLLRDVTEQEEVSFWKSEASGLDCMCIAKCVGQLMQVKRQGFDCVDVLNIRSP